MLLMCCRCILEPQELFPGTFLATPTHYFMRLLHDKGLLLRCFTQARSQALLR